MKQIFIFLPILFLAALFSACEKNREDYLQDNRNGILGVQLSADSIEADGKSILIITATISESADRKKVRFSSSAGKFQDSNQSYTADAAPENGKLVARAYLYTTQDTGSYSFVRVSVPGLDTVLHYRAVTAYPEQVRLESATASISSKFGSEVPVTAYLYRKSGIPSKGQPVVFRAYTRAQEPIGDFRGLDAGTNEKGLANAIFVLKDTSYTGPVYIVGHVWAKNKVLLEDTLRIFVTK